ncbi:leucine-rich repeats and immunoglobulin-like domains protein 1 [Morone saxatilis]|uniref:leucine-rich repeats and immunoglobulin-like domains protein 1 n=1 Tax=Morone saxatilis TaxID=34816 RepID=UPI0015E20D86|nr:leucine-rich repeats and immunoglobulin-like domains protein 1 [Morone saxatilis]
MVEFRWITFSLFLMLVFHFPAATWTYSSFNARVGDEVTLSCENMIDDQDKCDSINWVFGDTRKIVTLFERGQIHRVNTKSDRLSVTQNCSLVVKNVTVEDAGYYTCRQFISGKRRDAHVYLSVLTSKAATTTTTISATTIKSTPTTGNIWTTMQMNTLEGTKETASTNKHNETKQGDAATMATTISPTTMKSTSTIGNIWTTVKMSTSEGTKETASANNNNESKQVWWQFVIVFVALSALLIILLVVTRWNRNKGKKKQMDENMEHNDKDEDDGIVNYVNVGDPSVSVRL